MTPMSSSPTSVLERLTIVLIVLSKGRGIPSARYDLGRGDQTRDRTAAGFRRYRNRRPCRVSGDDRAGASPGPAVLSVLIESRRQTREATRG